MKDELTRTTIYFDPLIHKILKLKSAQTERSVSEIVNDALRNDLLEDQEDLETFKKRESESSVSYEVLLKKLKTHGKI